MGPGGNAFNSSMIRFQNKGGVSPVGYNEINIRFTNEFAQAPVLAFAGASKFKHIANYSYCLPVPFNLTSSSIPLLIESGLALYASFIILKPRGTSITSSLM